MNLTEPSPKISLAFYGKNQFLFISSMQNSIVALVVCMVLYDMNDADNDFSYVPWTWSIWEKFGFFDK